MTRDKFLSYVRERRERSEKKKKTKPNGHVYRARVFRGEKC